MCSTLNMHTVLKSRPIVSYLFTRSSHIVLVRRFEGSGRPDPALVAPNVTDGSGRADSDRSNRHFDDTLLECS